MKQIQKHISWRNLLLLLVVLFAVVVLMMRFGVLPGGPANSRWNQPDPESDATQISTRSLRVEYGDGFTLEDGTFIHITQDGEVGYPTSSCNGVGSTVSYHLNCQVDSTMVIVVITCPLSQGPAAYCIVSITGG